MSTPTRSNLLYLSLSDIENSILRYIYDEKLPTGICYVSYKLLSKRLGVSKKSIHKSINSLIEKGLIKRIRKGYYTLTEKAILYLETNRGVGYYSTHPTRSTPKPSPLIFLLSGIIGFEALERWAKQCFLYYRPHNIRLRIPLIKVDNRLYGKKISTPFGKIFIVDKANLDDNPYLVVELIDYELLPSHNLGRVIDYVHSLPYKIASYLEQNYDISIDYGNIAITHVALGIVLNPNEIPNDIVNKLVGWMYTLNVEAKKSLFMVDKSVGYPEIELETDDVNKLYEVLVLMFPITLIEFIRKDIAIDEEILNKLNSLEEKIDKLLKNEK